MKGKFLSSQEEQPERGISSILRKTTEQQYDNPLYFKKSIFSFQRKVLDDRNSVLEQGISSLKASLPQIKTDFEKVCLQFTCRWNWKFQTFTRC